jgi:acyl-CoA synthetase (NDP forming)
VTAGAAGAEARLTFPDLGRLLRPEAIAVVGASDRPGNLGGDTVRHLLKFGYRGSVWPVNPHQSEVAGLACYPSVRDLPGRADLAVLAVPAEPLLDAVRECAEAGIRSGVAFAGGFAEGGPAGAAAQARLAGLCRALGFQLCGPNCVGIINAATGATATFATALLEVDRFRPGSISMVSQSGGIATSAFAMAHQAGFGFRYLISGGNEAVVTFADYVHALAQDEGTRVIAGYLEGVGDGAHLLEALVEARRRGKVVVLMKAGATPAGARAAISHTGALAGEDRVYEAVFRETAVVRVASVEELVDVALLLSGLSAGRLPRGPGVGIVTFGGGNGVLAADQCGPSGLTVPPLSPAAIGRLGALLAPVASAANPMDLTPTTAFRAEWMARLPEALDVVASEPGIDALLVIAGSLASRADEISTVIEELAGRAEKPVCVSWPVAPRGVAPRLAARGLPVFSEPARALRALGGLARHAADLGRPPRREPGPLPPLDWATLVPMPAGPVDPARRAEPLVVPEHRCAGLLLAAGLPVAEARLATTEADAVAAARGLGLPVALKVLSPAVAHRLAAGLVAVDRRTLDEVREAFQALTGRAREAGVDLDGVWVQRMAPGVVELLVSAFRDPLFGPMVACAAGGSLTELLDDVVMAREVNPIRWSPGGVVAVDGLLVIEAA